MAKKRKKSQKSKNLGGCYTEIAMADRLEHSNDISFLRYKLEQLETENDLLRSLLKHLL